jgi:hypothetical protein
MRQERPGTTSYLPLLDARSQNAVWPSMVQCQVIKMSNPEQRLGPKIVRGGLAPCSSGDRCSGYSRSGAPPVYPATVSTLPRLRPLGT